MIRINLLPFRKARAKENVRQQISVFFLALVLSTLAMSYIAIYCDRKINGMDEQIKNDRQQLESLNKLTKEISEIKKSLEIIKKKTAVIKNLQLNRKSSAMLLDAMTCMVIPNRMWFTSLSDIGATVSIAGMALDNKTVADFMVRLETSGLFSSVRLNTLRQQSIKNVTLKSFDVSCSKIANPIHPPAGKAAKK